MSKFDTEKVIYPCREQSTEDLLFDADMHWHNGERKDAADVLFNVLCDAIRNNDQKLIDECLKRQSEMRNQFCSFTPSYTASEATDNHNRPTEPPGPKIPDSLLNVEDKGEEEWDDTYDYIFDEKVKPQALFNAMKGTKYSDKITDRRFYYVAYRVFDAINYFSKGTSEHQYLQWINLHFNDYEKRWIDDHDHIYLFRFKLDGTAKELKVHPAKWNTIKMYSDLAAIHYKLANDLKNTFTFVVDDNGDELKYSESYEHLKDYPQYLSGAKWIVDRFLVPEEAYLNKG